MDLAQEAFRDTLDLHAQALKAAFGSDLLNTQIPGRDTDFYIHGLHRKSHRWQLVGGSPKGLQAKGLFWIGMHHQHMDWNWRGSKAVFIGQDGTLQQRNAKDFLFPLENPDLAPFVEACRTAFTGCARVYFGPRRGAAACCRACPNELVCAMEGLLS